MDQADRRVGGSSHTDGVDSTLDELVDAVESSSVELADSLIRGGAVSPPTVHILCKHRPQRYLGSVATRPFRRGADAGSVVAALGLLPSVVTATRLVVVWEYSDLCAALDLPGWRDGRYPLGLVVLDADLSEHVVRWHPFTLCTNASSDRTVPLPLDVQVWPAWGPVTTHPCARLPAPVVELLAVWRDLRRRDIGETLAELEAAGFLVNCVSTLVNR